MLEEVLAECTINLLNSAKPNNRSLANKITDLILISPRLDVSLETSKIPFIKHSKIIFLQEAGLEMMKCFYLNDEQTGKEPDISPLYHHLDSLKLMPNTNIIVGEIDRLLTDAVAATYLIKHANVPVKLTVLEGQSHNHFSHRDLETVYLWLIL